MLFKVPLFLLHLSMITGAAVLFLLVFVANEWLFNSDYFAFIPGINWIYLVVPEKVWSN